MTDQSNLPAVHTVEPERMSRVNVGTGEVTPIIPKTIDEVLRVARMVFKANIAPDSLTKENGQRLPDDEIVSRICGIILAGSEINMGPMTALAHIALVNKRRVIWGAGAVALLQRSGMLESMVVETIGEQEGDRFPDTYG